MPMDFKFVNDMPLEPVLCHFNHWDATQGMHRFMGASLYSTASTQGLANQSIASIEASEGLAVP